MAKLKLYKPRYYDRVAVMHMGIPVRFSPKSLKYKGKYRVIKSFKPFPSKAVNWQYFDSIESAIKFINKKEGRSTVTMGPLANEGLF